MRAHQQLDNVACDINFTRAVDLVSIPSNAANNSKTNAILNLKWIEKHDWRFYMTTRNYIGLFTLN